MSEPFLPASRQQGMPLSTLAQEGVDVSAAQQACRHTYLDWSSRRLEAVLHALENGFPVDDAEDPRSHRVASPDELAWPDVVVFPEYSIPFEQLEHISRFAKVTGATVFAGTHGLRRDIDDYSRLGFFAHEDGQPVSKDRPHGRGEIECYSRSKLATKSVMPIFNVWLPGCTEPCDILLPKRVLSIFEMTEAGNERESHNHSAGKAHPILSIRPRKEPFPQGKRNEYRNRSRPGESGLIGPGDSGHPWA